jgi:DnaJ family protein C protein 17
MEDRKSELLQYAREYATANKDLYALLSVGPDAAAPEIHRAWRKASLKHHPDKAAENFDPETWQLFERARDVLASPEARAVYDSARAAALQALRARNALDSKRREMIEDLEARERGVKRKAGGNGEGGDSSRHMMTEAEKRALMEKGHEHLEKRRRMKEEAEARERERERVEEAQRKQPTQSQTKPVFDRTHIPTPTAADNGKSPTEAPPPPADEYDERIADLERRLRERKAEKAARKAKAAGKKNNTNHSRNDVPIAGQDHREQPPPTIPISTNTPTSTAPLPTPKPAPLGDFTSTMAKLRAAQREKERKRADADAAAAAATAMALDSGGP